MKVLKMMASLFVVVLVIGLVSGCATSGPRDPWAYDESTINTEISRPIPGGGEEHTVSSAKNGRGYGQKPQGEEEFHSYYRPATPPAPPVTPYVYQRPVVVVTQQVVVVQQVLNQVVLPANAAIGRSGKFMPGVSTARAYAAPAVNGYVP